MKEPLWIRVLRRVFRVDVRYHVLRCRDGRWGQWYGPFYQCDNAVDQCCRSIDESRSDPRDLKWCVSRELVWETRIKIKHTTRLWFFRNERRG